MTMFPFSSEDVQERFVSAEQLMRVCDQVWSADGRAKVAIELGQPQAGSCVYCKVDHLIGLFDQTRQARNCVVLVSSESDRPINKEFLERCPPQIAHWFSTNIQTKDDRLSALPLGLSNSYCGITLRLADRGKIRDHSLTAPKLALCQFSDQQYPAVAHPMMDYFAA